MSANPDRVLTYFSTEYGFSPSNFYCSVTGKSLGLYDSEEFESILSLVCASNDSEDAAADDLATRCLASMRPSLRWNKFRSESLAQLRKSDPLETLAYLLNRMFAPLNRLRGGGTIRHLEARIKTWQQVESWGVTDDTNTLSYMLLEIDAKMGLDVTQPPFNWSDFVNAKSMKHRVEMLQGWYKTLMECWEKRLKDNERQIRWMRSGNVLAKPAFRDAFIESKPLTVTAIKKAEKKAERDFFAGILFEVMGGKAKESPEEAENAKPNPVVVPLRPLNPFAKRKDS